MIWKSMMWSGIDVGLNVGKGNMDKEEHVNSMLKRDKRDVSPFNSVGIGGCRSKKKRKALGDTKFEGIEMGMYGMVFDMFMAQRHLRNRMRYGFVSINKGLIKEKLKVSVKGKVYEVRVVEEIRDITMIGIQDDIVKKDDKRYMKEENDMEVDEEEWYRRGS
ncbi:hypothetical protein Tco_0801563 [Tanacetum coccineum]|uniref:Uncharacterized protein n=1 Tax=Tanacetum coccineum TaxID=301880 RepID=A0ABQ4ZX85_9ASTR